MRQRINPGRMRMWGFHIATSLLPMAGSWLKVLNCAAIRCEAGFRRCSSLQRIEVYCLSLAERRNILNSHINLAKTVTDGYHVASWRLILIFNHTPIEAFKAYAGQKKP
jgi:hypothetical protein